MKWLNKYYVSITIGFIFILSRCLFSIQGIRFDNSMVEYTWQFLDMELLKHNLLESLWYLHSQPPIFNFLLGISLKILGSRYAEFFHVLFFLIGLLTALMMGDILKKLAVHQIIGILCTVIFFCSPAAILYENWLFYSHLEPFFLVLITWCFVNYFQSGEQKKFVWLLFGSTCGLCLTRSMFHIIFFIVLIGIVLIFSKHKRQVIWASAIPFLLILGWYTKNFVMFGSFTASSWFGMNLARISCNNQTALGSIGVWESPEKYDDVMHFKAAPYPVAAISNMRKTNGTVNYNYFGYVAVSQQFKKESMKFIEQHPALYIDKLKQSFNIFFEPSAQVRFSFLEKNRKQFPFINLLYNFGYENENGYIDDGLIWINKIIYLFISLASLLLLSQRDKLMNKTIILIMYMSLFVLFVGISFEILENNRFRYATIPLFWMLASIQLNALFQVVKKKIKYTESQY